jgi:hypothetical protein
MRNLDSCRRWRCMLCPCNVRHKFFIHFWNRTILLCMPCTYGDEVAFRATTMCSDGSGKVAHTQVAGGLIIPKCAFMGGNPPLGWDLSHYCTTPSLHNVNFGCDFISTDFLVVPGTLIYTIVRLNAGHSRGWPQRVSSAQFLCPQKLAIFYGAFVKSRKATTGRTRFTTGLGSSKTGS